jgi:DNA-binding protein H-NS
MSADYEDYLEQIQQAKNGYMMSIRDMVTEYAKLMNMSVEDVLREIFPTEAKALADPDRRVLKPLYRNPFNPNEVWSGRGRLPNWMVKLMDEKGMEKDDFLIENQERRG